MKWLKRFFSISVSILFIFVISKALIRLLPGDPLDSLLGETSVSVSREKIAEDLGLNLGWIESYRRDFSRLIKGDFGYSLVTREPVFPTLLKQRATLD